MKREHAPDWFRLSEELNPSIFERLSRAVSSTSVDISTKFLPEAAFWFLCDSLLIANRANRDGMHANSLAITRSCVEAITIIELGLIGTTDAQALLLEWSQDEKTPGQLRLWLEKNAWPRYGAGLWSESWIEFYGRFARAIQPFAHYSGLLSQWQHRLHMFKRKDAGGEAILEFRPRAYDPQKATRITLFHGIISFVLGCILSVNVPPEDGQFREQLERLRLALGESPYLDGHGTDWPQQFWAMMWFGDSPIPIDHKSN
jgi:hypothetical protein